MEQELVIRASKGDLQAFTQIVRDYQGFLMAVVLPIVQSRPAAEDVLQETFIQVYRSLSQHKQGSFNQWLARIATNKAIDWKRKEKRRCPETAFETIENVLTDGITTEERVIGNETLDHLIDLCNQLPVSCRNTFVAFYLEGKDYRTLAQQEGVSIKTIESRLYRGRKIIREKWKEDKYAALR